MRDLCVTFLILNHSNNEIIKANLTSLQNVAEISLNIVWFFSHMAPPFPKFLEGALNLLEEEECSSSDQERNNAAQNFPFAYFM